MVAKKRGSTDGTTQIQTNALLWQRMSSYGRQMQVLAQRYTIIGLDNETEEKLFFIMKGNPTFCI